MADIKLGSPRRSLPTGESAQPVAESLGRSAVKVKPVTLRRATAAAVARAEAIARQRPRPR